MDSDKKKDSLKVVSVKIIRTYLILQGEPKCLGIFNLKNSKNLHSILMSLVVYIVNGCKSTFNTSVFVDRFQDLESAMLKFVC
jgi:hypothetical protein